MLQNRIYRGEIVHKDQAYPGEHEPIIDEDLWQKVQTTLAANRVDRGAGKGNRHLSLLAGLIYDAHGEPMTPSHAVKKGIRYRYYVSKSLLTGDNKATKRGQRIPAAHIEALVTGRIAHWLADPVVVLNAVQCCGPDAVAQKTLLDEAARLAAGWQDLDAEHLRAILRRHSHKSSGSFRPDRRDTRSNGRCPVAECQAINSNLFALANMIENGI